MPHKSTPHDKTRTDFLKDVTKQLVKIRKELSLTQCDVNEDLGVTSELVSKWECGLRTPSGFNLYCWADTLNELLTTVPKGTKFIEITLDSGETIKRNYSGEQS